MISKGFQMRLWNILKAPNREGVEEVLNLQPLHQRAGSYKIENIRIKMKIQIKNRIIDYFHNRDEIIAVYAFGSQVRGNTREDSDIDIGVLLETTQVNAEAEKRIQYQADLSRQLNGDVHVVVMNAAGGTLLN